MATRSLGSLTLDLIAKFGGFEAGMDRAARRVDSNFKRIEASSQRLMRTVRTAFAGVLAGIVSIQGARNIIRLSDQYSELTNRLRVVTSSSEELAKAQETVFGIAQRTRTSLESSTQLYSKLALATEQLGLSQESVARLTELTSKAIQNSGASAAGAAAAMEQFGQALQSGTLSGDEFKTLREQAPELLKAIANALGVSLGELRKLAKDQKLTTELIIQGILSQGEAIEATFSKTVVTVSQALTQLENAFLKAVGTSDLSPLADAISEITEQISDPQFQTALASLVAAIVKLSSISLEGLSELGNLGTQIGLTFARITGNISALDEIEAKITEVDRAIRGSVFGTPIPLLFTSDKDLLATKQALEAQRDLILGEFGSIERATTELSESAKTTLRATLLELGGERTRILRDLAREEDRIAREGFGGDVIGIEKQRAALASLEKQIERINSLLDKVQEFTPTAQRIDLGEIPEIELPDASKAEAQIKSAQQKIKDLVADLRTQNETFGQSAAAILQYRISFGDLKDTLDVAGAGFKKFLDEAVTLQQALDAQRAVKSIDELIRKLDEEEATLGLSAIAADRYAAAHSDLALDIEKLGPLTDEVREKFEQYLARFESVSQAKAVQSIKDQLRDLKDETGELNAANEAFSASLGDQAGAIRAANDAALEYSLTHGALSRQFEDAGAAADALTDAYRDQAKALEDARERNANLQEGAALLESTRTKTEQYAASLSHLKDLLQDAAVTDEVYGRQLAITIDEYLDIDNAAKAYRKTLEELERQLASGELTQKQFQAAIGHAKEVFEEAGREAGKVFTEQAQRNTQDILANFLADPFSKGLDGLVQDFETAFRQIAANALAAKIADNLFNGFDEWISKIGGLFSGSGLFEKIGGFFGSLFGGGGGGSVRITAAGGGKVTGPGTGTSDSIPAMLSAGEFVVRASVVKHPGVLKLLEDLNNDKIRIPFAKGGLAEKSTERISNQFSKLESSSHAETVRDISKRFESRDISRNFYALRSILGMATGGVVRGPGTETSDSVPAFLSAGEYVVKAESVKRPGVLRLLESVNAGIARFAEGGLVAAPAMALPGISNGTVTTNAMYVTQQFNIEAPRGSVNRQTQMQIGAAAARGLRQADIKNN